MKISSSSQSGVLLGDGGRSLGRAKVWRVGDTREPVGPAALADVASVFLVGSLHLECPSSPEGRRPRETVPSSVCSRDLRVGFPRTSSVPSVTRGATSSLLVSPSGTWSGWEAAPGVWTSLSFMSCQCPGNVEGHGFHFKTR